MSALMNIANKGDKMGKTYISVRELAAIKGFEVVGKLTRIADNRFGFYGHCPQYVDEAGNTYILGTKYESGCGCIVTADGGVI